MLGMLERSGSEGFEFNFDNGSWIVREVFVVLQQQQQREKRRVEEWLLSWWWWWWCWVEEGREARKNAMGNKVSRAVGGCFTPQGEEGRFVHGMQFSESLDAGLGHSFCYVRPVLDSPPPSALSPAHPVDSGDLSPPSLDIAIDFDANTNLGSDAQSRDRGGEVVGLSLQQQVARIELEQHNIKPRVGFERPPKHVYSEKSKNVAETSFKAISGASVSANTATPRSITSQEQFNSFSNVPIECAAAFESTSSFSALPLQRVANSGPLSGPLDSRGFLSGPLERGFMSGPLERGFMSGPIERGFMSGPLEPMDRSTFSAPLTSPYPGKKRASLRQFVRSMSKPVRKAIAKTVSKTSATLVRTLVVPMKNFVMREGKEGDREDEGRSSLDSLLDLGYYSSDLETKEGANLQWAQGKAGEDRVHVVLSEEHGWLFVGIYDGFNGPDAPDFLMSNLYPAIYRGLKGLLWDYNDGFDRFTCSPISEQDSSGDRVGSGGIGRDGIQRSDEDFLSWLGHPRASRNLNPSREECKREGVSTAAESSHDGGALVKVKIEDSKSVSPAVELHLESSSHDGALIKVKTEDSKIVSPAMELPVDICQQCSSSGRLPDSAEENLAPDTEEELHGPATSSCSSQVPVCKLETKVHEGDEVLQGVLHGDEQELEGKKPEARGSEHDATLVLEQEVKLIETSSNLNEVKEQKKSIREILLEPLEICPMLEIEKDRTKESKVLSPQLQWTHGHRREQHRKYPQWRYEWERERLEEEERQRENLRQEQEVREAQKSTVDHDAILNALAQALRATEDSYLEMVDRVLHENPEVALVGSCVLVMLMKDEDVYIMNVGDSRAIIAQDRRHASFSSLSRFSHVQPQTDSPMVDEQNRIGARDTLLRQELERIIEETPTELEALESSHDATSLVPPPPGSLLLSALQLSSDHSTSIPEEVERIKAEHPDDDNAISNDRVKGSLKVTRAFGAGFLKEPKWNSGLLERFRCDFVGSDPYITCSPFLHHHCLGPQDRFLVLSSDGLYQYLSNEEVVSHVEWCLEKSPDGDPAQCLIEELLFRAAKKNGMDFHELLDIPQGDRRKYHDDVSVMVISLEGRIWRSSS